MNIIKKWGWIFLIVMPGLLDAQNQIELKRDEKKLREVFHSLNLSLDTNQEKSIKKSSTIDYGCNIEYLGSDSNHRIYLDYFVFKSYINFLWTPFKYDVSFAHNVFEDDFSVKGCKFTDRFNLNNNIFYKNVSFEYDSTKKFHFYSNELQQGLSFNNCVFNNIYLSDNKINGDLEFKNCKFDTIDMKFNIVKQITFQNCILPDTIILKDLQPSGSQISFINCHTSSIKKKISIDITGCDLNNVEMDYRNFRLVFKDSLINLEVKRQAFLNLLENFKKKGLMDSYERLDLHYSKEYDSPHKHWLQKFWWNYGYSKNNIFQITSILLLVFTVFTMRYYNNLQSAYEIENARTNCGRFINSFIYANIIFWAFKLDIKDLKFRDHLFFVLCILIMHILGIICLAYLAKYLIQS